MGIRPEKEINSSRQHYFYLRRNRKYPPTSSQNDYQFYDNLYALVIQEQKYCPLNMESFENIYNALYLKMEDESDDAIQSIPVKMKI